ncbi:MAG TPA: molybdopterin cofactor-binding domain-containing protein, partial [Sphingomonadales bacterium]|nr:molybdopterin cofactor-binding domain-containing protein [Sphingomonadales bacterium]
LYVNVKCVLTHTPVVDAYRGAGRPEACYMLERAIDEAAVKFGLSPVEIRKKNFIPKDAMPFKTATGTVYDSGDFARNLGDALKNARWDSFPVRRKESEAAGRLRGIGLAYYIECTVGDDTEEVTLEFTADGKVLYYVGTQTTGQGHLTTFSQIIAERLGIDLERVELVEGDSTRKSSGGGTSGSRSLQMIGNAAHQATGAAIAKGKKLAAKVLEAEEVDFADGLFRARGTNRSIAILDLAEKARAAGQSLDVTTTFTKEASTFPNGCHIAEVEVDPETGVVEIVDYTVVDDFGVVINPLVVAGQVHGGVAQGLGQALTERVVFDDSGQILTGSFMDYGIPKAHHVPFIRFSTNEVRCATNPLGIKGCGEAGTIGACPAFMNAVMDALRPKGVRHLDMPATPERVWRALRAV